MTPLESTYIMPNLFLAASGPWFRFYLLSHTVETLQISEDSESGLINCQWNILDKNSLSKKKSFQQIILEKLDNHREKEWNWITNTIHKLTQNGLFTWINYNQ